MQPRNLRSTTVRNVDSDDNSLTNCYEYVLIVPRQHPTLDSMTRTAATAGNIHTGMEEVEHPVFGCCPFAGVYCKLCKTSITSEAKASQVYNMGRHILSAAHLEICDALLTTITLNQRQDFVASAERKLLPVAEELAKARILQTNADDARLLLAEYLMPPTDLFYCPICKRYYGKVRNHQHSSEMIPELGCCPKGVYAGGNNRLIALGYDPYNFSDPRVYPRLFRDLLNEEYTQQLGLVAPETERLPRAKRAKTTPQTRRGPDQIVTPRGSLQPPFQVGNSTAYVCAPPFYAAYQCLPLPGDVSQVGWPPWQMPYFNVDPSLFSAVAQPDFGEAESVKAIQDHRSQSRQEGQALSSECASKTSIKSSEKTGLPPANKASEGVRQDENEATVNCKGDSEEGQPCTQPARSTPIEDATTLCLLRQQPGPIGLLPVPSQERQGQSPAALKLDGSGEDIGKQKDDQADASVDVRSKTPIVQDCVPQPSVPAKAPQRRSLGSDSIEASSKIPASTKASCEPTLHEQDPARQYYVEERAYLFHNPSMPDAGIRPGEQVATADNLPPLPDAPPVEIPTMTNCKMTFCEESRVLLFNFKGVDNVSPADKRAFAEMLQRDDITVVAEGLLEGMTPGLLSLEYMAGAVKDHQRVRKYKRETSGDYITYEEKKGHLSMKLSDFLEYLKQRKQALNPSPNAKTETSFSFKDRELKEVEVDVTDPLYLIDMDMPNRLPHLFAKFSQAVKIPEILPGGEWCMMNEVQYLLNPCGDFMLSVLSGSISHFICLIHTL
jgi:hypothetical protein